MKWCVHYNLLLLIIVESFTFPHGSMLANSKNISRLSVWVSSLVFNIKKNYHYKSNDFWKLNYYYKKKNTLCNIKWHYLIVIPYSYLTYGNF